MDWLVENAAAIAGVTGAIGGVWTLLARIRKSGKAWLHENFASKQDIARIETMISTLMELHWQHNVRKKEK